MGGRRRRVAAALAAGATIGLYAAISPAASSAITTVSVAQVGAGLGSIGPGIGIGYVQAVQVGSSTRVGLTTSLHGLAPGRSYRIAYSPKRCTQASIWSEIFIFFRDVTAGRTMNNAFRTGQVTRRGALSSARSVRVYDISDPQRPQRACGTTSSWTDFTGSFPALSIGAPRGGTVSGLVPAVQASRSATRVGLTTSLHGLAPNTSYLVGISARPCSRSADANRNGVVDAADYVLFRVVTTGQGGDDVFRSGRVTRRGSLSSARSVRVIDVTFDRDVQVACRPTSVFTSIDVTVN